MNQNFKNELKNRLNKCETVSEMFALLNDTFELNTKVGMMSKPLFVGGVIKGIEMINPPLKKEKTHVR